MRVAVLSDIHANHLALMAVKDDLVLYRPDEIWFLGDLWGRGYEPQSVFDTMEMILQPTIKLAGNHDLAIAGNQQCFNDIAEDAKNSQVLEQIKLHRKLLSSSLINIIKSYATQQRRKLEIGVEIWLAHGWPDQNNVNAARIYDYLQAPKFEPEGPLRTRTTVAQGTSIWFVGHSHRQTAWLWCASQKRWKELIPGFGQTLGGKNRLGQKVESAEYVFMEDDLLILNPGSIGNPRDTLSNQIMAKYLTVEFALEPRKCIINFRAVPYL